MMPRQGLSLINFPVVFVAILLLPATFLRAQNNFYETEVRMGYVVKNYPVFPDLHGISWAGSFRFGKQLDGSKVWHKYYRFPYLGLDIAAADLTNKKVLGRMYTVAPEMMFSQQLGNRLFAGEILAMGLAFFDKPFDAGNNAENTLIGSRITAAPHASLGLEYYLSPYWSAWMRVSVYHASNCHYQLPNLGVNIPSVSLAVRYHPHPAVILNKDQTPFTTDTKTHFNIRFGLGVNERGQSTGPTGGPKRLIYLTQCYLTKNLAPVNKLQAGLEFTYNTGVYDTIHSANIYVKNQQIKSASAVFFLGHEFLLGHFSLSTQGGIFLYNPYKREMAKRENVTDFKEQLKTLFIARLGFQYYFKDIVLHHRNQLFAGIYVKTNFGQADFLDLGVGYTF